MKEISKHISYNEATFSATAKRLSIDNTPNQMTLEAMQLLAEKVFEPLREWYGKPIRVNSFYRSSALNKAVGGSRSSQHILGQAMDINAGSKSENEKLFNYIKDNLLFDQLINEYDFTWVHVSYRASGNRKQLLKIG